MKREEMTLVVRVSLLSSLSDKCRFVRTQIPLCVSWFTLFDYYFVTAISIKSIVVISDGLIKHNALFVRKNRTGNGKLFTQIKRYSLMCNSISSSAIKSSSQATAEHCRKARYAICERVTGEVSEFSIPQS